MVHQSAVIMSLQTKLKKSKTHNELLTVFNHFQKCVIKYIQLLSLVPIIYTTKHDQFIRVKNNILYNILKCDQKTQLVFSLLKTSTSILCRLLRKEASKVSNPYFSQSKHYKVTYTQHISRDKQGKNGGKLIQCVDRFPVENYQNMNPRIFHL